MVWGAAAAWVAPLLVFLLCKFGYPNSLGLSKIDNPWASSKGGKEKNGNKNTYREK